MDFQKIIEEEYRNEATFTKVFAKEFLAAFDDNREAELLKSLLDFQKDNNTDKSLWELFDRLNAVCEKANQPVVLMFDEVGSTAINRIFIDFLHSLGRITLAEIEERFSGWLFFQAYMISEI